MVTQTQDHKRVRITGFESGELWIRSGSEPLQRIGIETVRQILLDGGGMFDDLNRAERFMGDQQPQRALIRYRRALRIAEDFWRDLILARLVTACDAANQIDTATTYFIHLLNESGSGPAAAVRLFPQAIPGEWDKRATLAIQQIDAALDAGPADSPRAVLLLFRYEVLRATQNAQAADAARTAATLVIPADARSQRAFDIQLRALHDVLQNQDSKTAVTGLEQVIRDCPDGVLPDALLLKGWTLLQAASTRDEIIRASWPLMRVPIHFPDDPRAAEGLYGAALAMERLGRVEKALDLLAECLGHPRIPEQVRGLAESVRVRLQSAPPGPPAGPEAPRAGGSGTPGPGGHGY